MPLKKAMKKVKKYIKGQKLGKCDGTDERGMLHPVASSILMRVLYAARMARFDLLRAVNKLACNVAFWDTKADERLCRLVAYIKSSLDYRQTGWIGDPAHELSIHDYADADFAGCERTLRSTSGIQQQLEGPHSCFPLSAMSKRQAHCNDSTPAAELTSIHKCVKEFAVPAIDLWEILLPKFRGVMHEDNTTCITAIQTGKNQTMRFLSRAGGISISFLHEMLNKMSPKIPFQLVYTDSKLMVADIHTKMFADQSKWAHAHTLANILAPGTLIQRIQDHNKYFGLHAKIPADTEDVEM